MKKPMTNTPAEWRGLHLPRAMPKIRSDGQVRAFVDKRLITDKFKDIAQACKEKFGPARAPSKSTIGRYWAECYRNDETELARIKAIRNRRGDERSKRRE